jgi:hypothetical protein
MAWENLASDVAEMFSLLEGVADVFDPNTGLLDGFMLSHGGRVNRKTTGFCPDQKRAKDAARMRLIGADPEYKAKRNARRRERWATDGEYRARCYEQINATRSRGRKAAA